MLAVAVVAENGEHGSAMAPIAKNLIGRYIEKYPLGSAQPVPMEDKINNNNGYVKDQLLTSPQRASLSSLEHENHAH